MSRLAFPPVIGKPKSVPLKVPPDLAVDLHAFCEAHYGAPHTRVICEAVRRFIDEELARDPAADSRFKEIRDQLLRQGRAEKQEPIRLVSPSRKRSTKKSQKQQNQNDKTTTDSDG